MGTPRAIPETVLRRQTEASDPANSVWVAANAGSGKTYVLAQRVIRLLLNRVDPAKILCITFTKAAAANMSNRVFDTLRAWTVLDDDKLDEEIRKISNVRPDADIRALARRLFALALETPGGLKVQTIHAFCTRLLHQFPFEANVAARFTVLDEAAEAQLLDQVTMGVLLDAAAKPDTPLGRALATAVATTADQTLKDVIAEAIRKREIVSAWIDHYGGAEGAIADFCGTLGVDADDSIERVDTETVDGPLLPVSQWQTVAAALDRGSSNDQGHAKRLREAAKNAGEARAQIYRSIFLTNGEPRQRLLTKALQTDNPDLANRFQREQSRVLGLFEHRKKVSCRDRTVALLVIANDVIGRYQSEKDRRGLLDYEDLIEKTLAMLGRIDSAWVHYKLDLGIDHVLIDEAQDTNPRQWQIIRALVGEFFAGAGARLLKRTIFAVGDEKQSIFSFQGAAPQKFDEMYREFARLCEGAEQKLQSVRLQHSFRSGPHLLAAVDTVFERPEAYAGLSADNVRTVHEALPDAAPGAVELWNTIEPEQLPAIEAWDTPFDDLTETSPQVRLARKIAANVKQWGECGTHPGDVLVLVRQRGSLFDAIIRALKDAHVPVAGADRLVLTEHIAVMDLMVLADALLLPDDDLALATVLKSPLFGLNDDDLFALAWQRKGSLRAALRAKAATELVFAAADAKFDRLARRARTDTPFAFYARVLGAERGRRDFLARLGAEADDALDEFLNLALDYERRETPSLQGFIAFLRAARTDVKRDMEITRDEVRVMTVHGAKGLEARVVILADTITPPAGLPQRQPRLLPLPAEATAHLPERFLWAGVKATDFQLVSDARERARREAENEYRRLLYVAMTRAIERLVVCGAEGVRGRPEGCWYDLVRNALGPVMVEEPAADGDGTVWRFHKTASDDTAAASGAVHAPVAVASSPDWLARDASPEQQASAAAISPASAYDETELVRVATGADRKLALERGIVIHRLLQALPEISPEARMAAARQHLARTATNFSAEDRDTMAAQACGILDDARFAGLFGPGSRAEVPIVGRVMQGGRTHRVSGQVDRLATGSDAILIADYKTNRPAPRDPKKVPDAYVLQLALYRSVLAELYPGRPIRAALVWTDVPDLMEISGTAMDAALTAFKDR